MKRLAFAVESVEDFYNNIEDYRDEIIEVALEEYTKYVDIDLYRIVGYCEKIDEYIEEDLDTITIDVEEEFGINLEDLYEE